MITLRKAQDIFQAEGPIDDGFFHGRWHFSFDEYYDSRYINFGPLRVFNDDTLSPSAVWPLHPHRDIEVVTYCASGEFRHGDERGPDGVLEKGWVQHTTVGKGMSHSEINNSDVEPMRFVQMWFEPKVKGLTPSVEQEEVEIKARTNKFFPLISNEDKGSLRIASEAKVYSSFLEKGKSLEYTLKKGEGGYLYLLEGGSVSANGTLMHSLDAAMISSGEKVHIQARGPAELLFVVVLLYPVLAGK